MLPIKWSFDEGFARSNDSFVPTLPSLQDAFNSWISPATSVCIRLSDFSVRREGDTTVLSLDLPGTKPEDVVLEIVDGNVLRVSATRKNPSTSTCAHSTTLSTHVHSATLDDVVDPMSAEASLEDGVLEIRFGKRAETKSRRVTIKSKR